MKEMKALFAKAGAGSALAGGRVQIRQDFSVSAGRMALGIYKGNGRVFTLPLQCAGRRRDREKNRRGRAAPLL